LFNNELNIKLEDLSNENSELNLAVFNTNTFFDFYSLVYQDNLQNNLFYDPINLNDFGHHALLLDAIAECGPRNEIDFKSLENTHHDQLIDDIENYLLE
jgi:hypothetical protein